MCDITLFPLPVVIFSVDSSACVLSKCHKSERCKPKDREVTSNSDIVEEEYEQEEDEDIEGHEAAGQQEVHLQRIPEIFHQSRQSQP